MGQQSGSVAWIDMTVDMKIRGCFAAVVGCKRQGVDTGSYADCNMSMAASGEPGAVAALYQD